MQGKRNRKHYLGSVLAWCAAAGLTGPLPALAADASVEPPAEVLGNVATKAQVKDYEAGTIAPGAYTVIDRISVARWRSAFDVPAYADQASARRALLNEAARIGGDGVVNLHCIESAGPGAGVALGGHYCYGNVIKLK